MSCAVTYYRYFGLYQTIPIFICVITSYTVVCGSGLFKALVDRGQAKQPVGGAGSSISSAISDPLLRQQHEYAVSNYGQTKFQRKPTDL